MIDVVIGDVVVYKQRSNHLRFSAVVLNYLKKKDLEMMKVSTLLLVSWTTTALPSVDAAFGTLGFIRPTSRLSGRFSCHRKSSLCSVPPQANIVDPDTSINHDASVTSVKNPTDESETFVNRSPMAWLNPYLDSLGLKEGKTITYGVFAKDIDQTIVISEAEALRLRKEAAGKLENIGMEERNRRDQAATIMWAVTFLYAVWASLFADDGGVAGHVLRFLVILPSFLALGYKRSAETGVCNIAQAGLWDVDGAGLKKIEDPSIAQAILDKVNSMNFETATACFVGSAIFGLLPQSTTALLGFFAVTFAGKIFDVNKSLFST